MTVVGSIFEALLAILLIFLHSAQGRLGQWKQGFAGLANHGRSVKACPHSVTVGLGFRFLYKALVWVVVKITVPFLGYPKYYVPNIIGILKGTVILTTTHMNPMIRLFVRGGIVRGFGLQFTDVGLLYSCMG